MDADAGPGVAWLGGGVAMTDRVMVTGRALSHSNLKGPPFPPFPGVASGLGECLETWRVGERGGRAGRGGWWMAGGAGLVTGRLWGISSSTSSARPAYKASNAMKKGKW